MELREPTAILLDNFYERMSAILSNLDDESAALIANPDLSKADKEDLAKVRNGIKSYRNFRRTITNGTQNK